MAGKGVAVGRTADERMRRTRVRLAIAAAFGVLLASIAASYALADEALPPPSGEEAGATEVPHPDAAEITSAYEASMLQEEVREKELEEPSFVAERDASRLAYADITTAEAEELLTGKFGEALAELNIDPARFLSDAELIQSLGEGAAVVSSEGRTTLMEGPLPIEAKNEDGEAEKVDLSLEESPEGFEPENPIVETTIGASAEEGVALGGEEGLEIVQAGADESAGQEFGDKNVLYPEVDEGSDTDLLVSPTSTGVELFDMLRSVESPEMLRFQLSLPEGASLHAIAGGAGEVQGSDGSTLALIQKPSGIDAQGTYVPVSLEVEGDTVVLQTHHREEDLAYPILIDPEVVYEDWQHPNWYENQRLGALSYWKWESNSGLISHPPEDANWSGHHGLFIGTPKGSLPGGIFGYNYLFRNIGSYIQNATINIFYRANQGCTAPNPYPEPYDYDALYDSAQGHYNETHFNDANKLGNSQILNWGHMFIEGMGTASATSIPCARDLLAGGMELWWGDWDAPELTYVSGIPSGWIKMDNTQRTISVGAYDGGLGVKKIRLFGLAGREYKWNQNECLGTLEEPCAASRSGTITYETSGAAAYEGEQTVTVQALDPVEHGYHSQQYPVKLDGLLPAITMSGQFTTATEPTGVDQLSLPTYNLKIKAKDLLSTGGTGSGVKKLKVFLDGKEVASSGPTCTSSSCPGEYEWTYPLSLTGLSEAEHTLEVRSSDFVGNETKPETWLKKFEYIPATGMKEEYVLQHFVLPDGNEYSGEDYEGPELAVNVMNGNVVYRERDLKVQADSGNLELERIYNSQQPTARNGQWGHGWSLAQTPEFKPEAPEATKAKMLRTSAVTSAVDLPKTTSEPTFSSRLHATVAKTQGGGYEVRSAGEDETQVFGSAGRLEETRLSGVSPEVTVQPEPVFPVYAESLGSSGSGNGQLDHPADAAKDANGNLWVVDKANNRIVEFNEAGEFIREAGGLGSAGGKLSSPSAIAIDSVGNIDVTDTANNRVAQFSSTGAFIEVIGSNVNKTKVESGGTALEKNRCTAASGNTCQAGTAGSGEGQIAEPIGIATTGGQNFFVVERANGRVEKFSPQAEALAKFGSPGSEAGQLKEATAIAYSPTGNGYLWVADTGNNRIQEWTTGYSYVRAVGREGTGQAEFKRPAAVEADSEGDVWVGDQGNQRIQELDRAGGYITRFGGEGTFEFSAPMGVFLDSAGDLWITDSERDQVQEWMTGESLFKGSRIGSYGTTGTGQFNHPADIALDTKGNLWALDKGNNRLEKFNEAGEYLSTVGSKGGAAGQLNAPSALAIDPGGNLWVADTANNRVEEWNEKGEFVLTFGREVNKTKVETPGSTEAEKSLCTAVSGNVCQAGVAGSTNGQLKAPQGIAATSGGNIWVADTGNNRLKKFGPTGTLINNISSEGSEAGKVKEPTAVAMGPEGSIWVADSGNNRIEEWNSSLAFVRQLGSEGTGNGQFKRPAALEVDSAGNVWVGDQNNQRIEQFTSTGEYVAQLGSSSEFAFSAPMGVAADGKGGLWVTDTDHNRLQRILTGEFAKPVATQVPAIDYSYSGTALAKMELEEPEAPDPAITVATTSGLATSATSEAGTATYSYTAGNLTAAKDSEGEAKFEYDAGNRIKKVTLPNGTWATIAYDSVGRATKVIVKPAGETEKTTNFKYEAEPRRTYVWGTANPEVIYYIGEDGSVFKWENAATPPTIEEPEGSLWGHRNDPNPVENKDHTLLVTAESQNEIASIQVLINGHAIVAEKTCADPSSPPEHNCDRVTLEWITSAAAHPPGRLDLEVVATDFQERETGERFFVTIPQQPPPDPEAPEVPNFASIKQFREEFGLDRGKPLSEYEQNRLILELLYQWEAQLPAAMYSTDKWGMPMRQPEISEMEYRENYINQAAELIPKWADEHASTTYGGYYVDNRAGGTIYVGFTANQKSSVEALKQTPGLIAPSQIVEYVVPPVRSIATAEATEASVMAAISEDASVFTATSSVGIEPGSTVVEVGTTDTNLLSQYLSARFNSGSFAVSYQAPEDNTYSRFKSSGPVDAGDSLTISGEPHWCTAGFGASERAGARRGEPDEKYFVLSAAHCFANGTHVFRAPFRGSFNLASVGVVRRNGYVAPGGAGAGDNEDASAILLDDPSFLSGRMFVGNPDELYPLNGPEPASKGTTVCTSGVAGGVNCGPVRRVHWTINKGPNGQGNYAHRVVESASGNVTGDSGGPVWNPKTKAAVGLMSTHHGLPNKPCHEVRAEQTFCPRENFTPLVPYKGQIAPMGALPFLGVSMFWNR